jgi:hypothetical protein
MKNRIGYNNPCAGKTVVESFQNFFYIKLIISRLCSLTSPAFSAVFQLNLILIPGLDKIFPTQEREGIYLVKIKTLENQTRLMDSYIPGDWQYGRSRRFSLAGGAGFLWEH